MNKRILTLLVACLLLQCSEFEQNQNNILFISIDDLRPELGAYGKTHIHSPNIDALASEGMVFKKAYVQQAVCGPSRTSILTGLRPDGNKVTINPLHFRTTVPDVITLPQHFKNNGYHAVNIGKIYHGHDGTYNDSLSWSEPWWNAPPMYTNNIRGYLSYDNQQILAEINENIDGINYHASYWEAEDVPDNAYPDGMVVEKAIDVMHRIKDEPFFLAVGIEKPHLPFTCPKKYWDLYDPSTIELAENYYPTKGETPYTTGNWGDLVHYYDSPSPETITDDIARNVIHGYYACTSYADALVGQLLDALEEFGLKENTIVVLWGDHGWKLGEHFMWSKSTNYEIDANAPIIISYPDMEHKGTSTDAMVEFVDLYPTLADLAQLDLPSHLQGTSFVPVLENPSLEWKETVFSQYPRENGKVMGYSMKTNDYRYIRWENAETGEILDRELYDHNKDYQENFNIAKLPESQPIIQNLDNHFEKAYNWAHLKSKKKINGYKN
ncbi:MAG: sulfatase [Balneola sp.]